VGLSISNPSATLTANRLITKADTAGQSMLTATGVASATDTTAGSYTQVTASTSAEYLVVGIVVTTTASGFTSGLNNDLPLKVELATGAGGSETVKATFKVAKFSAVSTNYYITDEAEALIPLRVSSGTRLAVRATKAGANQGAAFTVQVDVIVVPYANVEGN
jgi:TfoX/Sxy family transcriptional regulator of competence genes